ncbi:sulfotransferase domain-containing protein [Microbacterium sp. ARD31]|uniref:sulfotransferase domain-containing protein n=1 Tax=Microbacterium sp. ARD31 TaxID=2962576 RepID=UPI002881F952|nr:sulfotransferase domain-containing protein [Microbacterium sp. ARD31]MDT0182781.1 sulfotransferase domain-containing protein [Microbacterium sp. ARD31]
MNVSDATPVGVMPYNYAVVGVQKGGTSTLAVTLNQHRLVCQPPDKERHYFDDETVDWTAPDYARDYTAPRRAAVHQLVGDASPTYLYWPHALERMRAYKPDMPLIAVFRDPLERLFSHWVMLRSRNLAWPDWPDFLTEWPHTSLPDEVPDPGEVRTMRWRHMTGLARGFYGEQLQRGFELFPRQQWLLLELRSMLADFAPTIDRTTDFLGLPRFEQVPPLRNWHAGADVVPGTAPTADDVSRLAELYAKDLALFEELSGIVTSAWPTRLVLDGRMDPGELATRFARKVR